MALTKIETSNLADDAVDIAQLGATGTADATTFLRGDNSWASAGGGLLGLVKYTGSGTYTVGGTSNGTAGDEGSTSVTKIVVEVQGAGGSGNREDSTDNYNSAGGGGGYAKKCLDVTDSSTVTVTVGAGGAGQSSNATAGNNGGLSSFVKASGSGSFTDVIGNGGTGGSTSNLAPSEGGTATGGDINVQGGVGSYNIQGHPAGGSILGNAGVSMQSTSLTNGRGYGAGGGSGRLATSGAGAAGIILIWEYK